MNIRKITIISIFVTISIILSFIEKGIGFLSLFPGAKLGLANIITILSIYIFGIRYSFSILMIRILVVGLFSGNAISFIYSIIGGLSSFIIMCILYLFCKKYVSIIGISTAGAVVHGLSQLIVASYLYMNIAVFSYSPYILLITMISGFLIGILGNILLNSNVMNKLKRKYNE